RTDLGRLTSLLPSRLLPQLLAEDALDVGQVLLHPLGDLGLPRVVAEPAIKQNLVTPLPEPCGIFLEQFPEVAADRFSLVLSFVLSRGRFLLCHENPLSD